MIDQLPLDLGHRTQLGGDDFLIAECNRVAVDWLDKWPDWPALGLVLTGPAGAGKSHLASIWAARAGARRLDAVDLAQVPPDRLLGDATALLIDPLDAIADETALFHLLNLVKERGAPLVLVARQPPASWNVALPDLRSRLLALPVVEIDQPDDALLAGVLAKLFHDRQITVGPDLIDYLVRRIDRSFAAARETVGRLDHASLGAGRKVTVAFARTVLTDIEQEQD